MPRFVIEPVNPDNPEWEYSEPVERCLVHANSEESAIRFASNTFFVGGDRRRDRSVPTSPWLNRDLIRIKEVNLNDGPYQEGTVKIPTDQVMSDWEYLGDAAHLESWETVASGATEDPLSINIDSGNHPTAGTAATFSSAASETNSEPEVGVWGKSNWNEATWAGEDSEDTEQEVAVEVDGEIVTANGETVTVTTSNQEIVRKVISNRRVLVLQSAVLLEFLEQIDRPGEGNEGNIQPLVLDDDEELKQLLKQLIAELRLFNSLLMQDKPQPDEVVEVSGAFREAGRNWLEKFSTSNGTRTGDLAAGCAATLLMGAGLLDPTLALMIFGGKAAGEALKKMSGSAKD